MPITAQQEPTSPPTVETLVETLGGRVSQNEQGEVVTVDLSRTGVTDASLAHLAGLTELKSLVLSTTIPGLRTSTRVTDAGLAHLAGLTVLETLGLTARAITDTGLAHLTELPALEQLYLEDDRWHSNFVGESKLQQALPNCTIPPRPTRAVMI